MHKECCWPGGQTRKWIDPIRKVEYLISAADCWIETASSVLPDGKRETTTLKDYNRNIIRLELFDTLIYLLLIRFYREPMWYCED